MVYWLRSSDQFSFFLSDWEEIMEDSLMDAEDFIKLCEDIKKKNKKKEEKSKELGGSFA